MKNDAMKRTEGKLRSKNGGCVFYTKIEAKDTEIWNSTLGRVKISSMRAILEAERRRYSWMQLIPETEYLH